MASDCLNKLLNSMTPDDLRRLLASVKTVEVSLSSLTSQKSGLTSRSLSVQSKLSKLAEDIAKISALIAKLQDFLLTGLCNEASKALQVLSNDLAEKVVEQTGLTTLSTKIATDISNVQAQIVTATVSKLENSTTLTELRKRLPFG